MFTELFSRRFQRLPGNCESLLNEDGSPNAFHLKNKGITIIADEVRKLRDGVFEVEIQWNLQGIVDGGHTYEIATDSKKEILSDEREEKIQQYIKFEILTEVPRDLWPEIAGTWSGGKNIRCLARKARQNPFRLASVGAARTRDLRSPLVSPYVLHFMARFGVGNVALLVVHNNIFCYLAHLFAPKNYPLRAVPGCVGAEI